MDEKVTELICIIDRSGSMASIKEDAIGGFNTFLEEQKKLGGDTKITVALFDDKYELLADSMNLDSFDGLNNENFVPRGMTAILDAIGKTISNVAGREDIIPTKKDYIVVILTDGEENASREYDKESVMKMIEKKTEDGWQFIYLGANQDAIREAGRLGIRGDFAGNFSALGGGASKAVLHASEMVMSYRATGNMTSYIEAANEVDKRNGKIISKNNSKKVDSTNE